MAELINSSYDKVYCYPNSNVIKNKFNIKNQSELHEIEREYTSLRAAQIKAQPPLKPTFSKQHLKQIHHHIFQDLYDWAGKFRTVDIAKGNMFCRVMFIENQLDDVFRQLQKENFLKNTKDKNAIGQRLGYYLAELNAVHPFREGNGRTQREFIRQLAEHNGYHLDYSKIPEGELLKASIQAFNCNYDYMQNLITNALEPINKPMTKEEKNHLRLKLDEKNKTTSKIQHQKYNHSDL